MSDDIIKKAADNIRILSAAMPETAKSGHPGGAMGGADFIAVLFAEFLELDPDDMTWRNRDRFFLDPGHMSPMLYSIFHLMGTYSTEEIKQFRQWGSPTPGHPELDVSRGVENTSGPLGQGHCMALGAAIAERILAARFGEWMAHKTYVYISDGGIQEEIAQGVGRLAGHLGLGNLIMFYDSNDIQLSHKTEEVTSEDTARKYEAWGWAVETVDAHDIGRIRQMLNRARERTDRPSLIIGKAVMGKGAVTAEGESFESQTSTHGQPLSKAGADFAKTVANLGGNPDDPFAVFPEVKEYFSSVLAAKRKSASAKKEAEREWAAGNPEAAAKLDAFFSGKLPRLDWAGIEQKANSATRAASGTVLGALAGQVENLIVASADLSNSDKTDGFLKKTTALTKSDFSGGFLQMGVSELTMAGVMNGLALHGGVIPVCGTFFAFSDFMKPAVRLAALMGLPVKYVWTHDSFRVGEDGPTHQPVEQEAQIRLLEKMQNLEGRRSMLVLRPSDAAETTVAWKMALENTQCPSALILSRQNIADIPARSGGVRLEDAWESEKGAYIVNDIATKPDIVLVANGSEVATLVEVAEMLKSQKGMAVQVVSAPSNALFLEQDEEYRESVIPTGVPTFGLTAGLGVALADIVGPLGKAMGMTRFGASAPYKVLDEQFGYTGEKVIKQVEAYLGYYKENVKKLSTAIS